MKNKRILMIMGALLVTCFMLFGCGNDKVTEDATTPTVSEAVEENKEVETLEEDNAVGEAETTEEVEKESSGDDTSEAVENVIPTDEGALSESEKYEMLKNITIPDKEYTEWELSELEVTAQILREMGEKPEQYLELSKNLATAEGPGKTYFYEWAVEELIGWENIPKELQEIIQLD